MAASYQTGAPTSPTNLLQTLVTWLVAQGWTQNMSQADGTGWRAHLSKGGIYVNLRATPGGETLWGSGNYYTPLAGIGIYTGTGYSGASAWNAQAGGPIGNGVAYTVGAFMQTPAGVMTAYHFFDDGSDNIAIVVERTSGIFSNMGWGSSITKAGTWTGGAYFFGSLCGYGNGLTTGAGSAAVSDVCPFAFGDAAGSFGWGHHAHIRADVDTFTGKWLGCGAVLDAKGGYTGKLCATGIKNVAALTSEFPNYETFKDRQVSAMNTQANLLPVRIFAQRDTSGYSLLGDLPNIFQSNAVGSGFAYSTVYSIGADNYMAFPNFMVKKNA